MPRKAKVPPASSLPQPGKHAAKQTACLCLLCRQVGHVIKSCPYLSQGKCRSEFSGLTLPTELEAARLSAAFDSSSSPTIAAPEARSLCQRCKNLNIFSSLTNTNAFPFTLDDKDPDHANRAKRKIRALGPAMTLQLLSTCPLCCLIFDITYLAEDDLRDITHVIHGPKCLVVLVLAWTINRLEWDLRWTGYAKGEGPYARCLYTSVLNSPEEAYARAVLVNWAMDAVGVEEVREGGREGTRALGLKKVDLTPNYDIIGGWLHRCDDLHHTCLVRGSQKD